MKQSLKILTFASYQKMPWKNGLGMTAEMFRLASESDKPPVLRLSMATLDQPGPFSLFAGMDRTIVALDGGGFELAHDGGKGNWVPLLEPYAFSGDARTVMTRIDGTTLDFNVMVDRTWGRSEVRVVSLAETPTEVHRRADAVYQFIVGHGHGIQIHDAKANTSDLPHLGAWLLEDGDAHCLAKSSSAGASLLVVTICVHK